MQQILRTCALSAILVMAASCDKASAPTTLGDSASMDVASAPPPMAGPMPRTERRVARPMARDAGAGAAAEVQAQAVSAVAAVPAFDPSAMIIRSATAGIEVDSLDRAVTSARIAATRYGGIVANANVSTGREETHRATIQIRVPAARFDSLLAGLAPLGRVEGVTISTQDVGEEYVDIEARLANLRRLEARIVELLATRTGKLADVLSVEHELARVRGEIEQIEGRRRFLQRSVAMSTLDLTLHEREPILAGTPGTNPIADAVHLAWRNFVGAVAWAIAALGVVIPVVILLLGVALLARWLRRRSGPAALGGTGTVGA